VSNTLAIAAVTQVFSDLLRDVQDNPLLGPTTVTNLPPDQAAPDPLQPERRLNLFLYQVSPNAALSSNDLPFRDASGTVTAQPVLALNLHYLLTAFGLNGELDTHHLLAHAMSLVHETGFLDRDKIRQAVNTAGSAIAGSDLADQIELVRIAPQMLTEEDLYRLWTVFQTSYRLSVGYQASVVLIERGRETQTAPPVQSPRLTTLTIRSPLIVGVSPQPATLPGTLSIQGERLDASSVVVRFLSGDVTPAPDAVTPTSITVDLPADLAAGPNTVQVVQGHQLEDSTETRETFVSNAFPFVVIPSITGIPAGGFVVHRSHDLTLDLTPSVGPSQRVVALIGTRGIPRTIDTSAGSAPTGTVSFAIPSDFPLVDDILRVQVDGVESALDTDPGTGEYVAPRVRVLA
jgi:Pvc16 N-terminal domain